VKLRIWGTRGSLATPGEPWARYGGNTSCVEVRPDGGGVIVIDAGTALRLLGPRLLDERRVDVLLSHLHMDHIQGLGFFAPLFAPGLEVHLWGPASSTLGLGARLSRYLSPPLFPLRLHELPCNLHLHDVPFGPFELPTAHATAALVCHPGPTVGYRIEAGGRSLAYLSDHEPFLGQRTLPGDPNWTSGYDLAAGADVLVHDTQYTDEGYKSRIGWGHSTLRQACTFTALTGARRLVAFHHDPDHDDAMLDELFAEARAWLPPGVPLVGAKEGLELDV
jgi:phosphoribosyl 1,2-cyclic phosphodiesterase